MAESVLTFNWFLSTSTIWLFFNFIFLLNSDRYVFGCFNPIHTHPLKRQLEDFASIIIDSTHNVILEYSCFLNLLHDVFTSDFEDLKF